MLNTFSCLVFFFICCLSLHCFDKFTLCDESSEGWVGNAPSVLLHTPLLLLKQGQAQTSQHDNEKKLLHLLNCSRLFPCDQTDQLPSLEKKELINNVTR